MDHNFTIRKATTADIPELMALARSSESAAHWSAERYCDLFTRRGNSANFVVLAEKIRDAESPILLAFLVARHLADEWELENIVVAESARRKGIGMHLLNALLTAAHETQSDAVFLEVRDSNAAARALYERAGFQETGRRKSYYSNPVDDAILYRLPCH